MVKASVDIVQCYCVFCGVNCGNSNIRYRAILLCFVCSLLWLHNSRYRAMLLCFVWSLLWLQQQ